MARLVPLAVEISISIAFRFGAGFESDRSFYHFTPISWTVCMFKISANLISLDLNRAPLLMKVHYSNEMCLNS